MVRANGAAATPALADLPLPDLMALAPAAVMAEDEADVIERMVDEEDELAMLRTELVVDRMEALEEVGDLSNQCLSSVWLLLCATILVCGWPDPPVGDLPDQRVGGLLYGWVSQKHICSII